MPSRTWSQQFDDDEKLLQLLAAQHHHHHHHQKSIDGQQTWRSPTQEQENVLRDALLAASQTPGSHHAYQSHEQRPPHQDSRWVSPITLRPSLHSYHSFPGVRSDSHVRHPILGTEHHGASDDMSLSLSQPLLHLNDAHYNAHVEHQLSAVSAPDEFMRARNGDDNNINEGAAMGGSTRAQNEPDPDVVASASMSDVAVDQEARPRHDDAENMTTDTMQTQGSSPQ